MGDPNIEEIKSHICAFIQWIWLNGHYQIVYDGSVTDHLSDNELLVLAHNFANARARALVEGTTDA